MRRKILFGVTLVFLIAAGWLYWTYKNAVSQPVIQNTLLLEIEKGDSFAKITRKLITQGATIDPLWFKVIAYSQNIMSKLKAGEYELTPDLSMPQILAIFAEGKSKKYSITFPEGWSFKDVLEELKNNPNLTKTLPPVANEVPALLGMAEKTPEGWIFPDTYYFEKNATDSSILQRAYHKMQSVLAEEWQNKASNLPYKTPYEALIMASIVEKETGASHERPMIAGVFTLRLEKGMLLQTDPTVIYGMGDKYQGNIRAADLTTPTPYNTYVIQGLPPTPIAMPGREAIHAALNPDKTDKLYFVAKGDGSHQFSATVSEHNRAVNLFQKHKK